MEKKDNYVANNDDSGKDNIPMINLPLMTNGTPTLHTTTPDGEEVGDLTPEKVSINSESAEEKKDVVANNDDVEIANGGAPGGEERAAWGGKLEFIFTCIGYAVGLGNVWRFPYLCYKNGGGAFLVPYIIMLGLVGLPLFYMELCFGQFASLGPITVWKINPLFKGLGYAMVSVSWLIALYYNVIISHVMFYLFASLKAIVTGMPWTSCDNEWNTEACITPGETEPDLSNISSFASLDWNITRIVATFVKLNLTTRTKTPAEEYYYHKVLQMSDGMENMGNVNWQLCLCLLFSWVIVLVCLIRGIQSLGKVVYFTAIFPYIMLTVLLIRGVTLPGAIDGIKFYLTPDFSRLTDPRVWSDATTQIFYSLSACSGGLIAMSSYNKFSNNCYKDAMIVSLVNCATSIYAGFVIFCVLGFMAREKGVEVSDVAAGGPGLAFIVYPEALARMPVPQLWAVFFFFMMATLGFGSQFSIVECVLSAFSDEFAGYLTERNEKLLFRVGVILSCFLLGIPMVTKGGIYLLNLVDYSVSGFPLLFVGLLECAALAWIYGMDQYGADIEMMLGHKPGLYWRICWKFVTPFVIIITIVSNCVSFKKPSMEGYEYSTGSLALGWLITLFPMLLIIVLFAYRYCMDGGWLLLKEVVKPLPDWGPAMPENRTGRYEEDGPTTPWVLCTGDENRFNFDTRRTIGSLPPTIRSHIIIPTPLSRSRNSVYIGGSRVSLAASKTSLNAPASAKAKAMRAGSLDITLPRREGNVIYLKLSPGDQGSV